MPADRVILLPDSVGWDEAALLEPLAVAAHAMELVRLRPGESFALVGPGPFGLLMCRIARTSGAARVIAVGREGVDEARLEVARRLGVDATLAFSRDAEAVAAAVSELTATDGADVVMDCGGTPESTPSASSSRARRAASVSSASLARRGSSPCARSSERGSSSTASPRRSGATTDSRCA